MIANKIKGDRVGRLLCSSQLDEFPETNNPASHKAAWHTQRESLRYWFNMQAQFVLEYMNIA